MTTSTISIFENKIFLEIINEIGLFSEFKIKYYEDINICINNSKKEDSIIIFFLNKKNEHYLSKLKTNNFPFIIITENNIKKSRVENFKKKWTF